MLSLNLPGHYQQSMHPRLVLVVQSHECLRCDHAAAAAVAPGGGGGVFAQRHHRYHLQQKEHIHHHRRRAVYEEVSVAVGVVAGVANVVSERRLFDDLF